MLTQAQIRSYWAPRCNGPFATVSLNGAGKVVVDAAIVSAVKSLNQVLTSYKYYTRYADTGAYNCLSGDTLVVTRDGWFPIKDAVGQQFILTTEVGRGGPGRWTEAEIRSFGHQELWEIIVERLGIQRTVRATADHRWIVRPAQGAFREVVTCDLEVRNGRSGHRLASIKPQSVASRTELSPEGIAAGIVFGDGTIDAQGARALLCGSKDNELEQWFHPSHKRLHYDDVTVIRGLPKSWKNSVPLDEGVGVLYGWLAGYFAADGRVTAAGVCELNSADKWRLEQARTAALRLGIASSPITSVSRIGYGNVPTELYSLRFDPRSLDASFFLIESHRQRWESNEISNRAPDWSVVSVRPTGEWEEVFCAVVPETECFAIEDFILTGNCRMNTSGTAWSIHAYGIALDLNWQSNPYSRYLRTDMFRYGDGKMPYRICAIRTNNGKQIWNWGGFWSGNKDAMHYEIVCSPADLRTGINWGTVYGAGGALVPTLDFPAHLSTKEFLDMDEATFRRILDERLKVAEDRQNAWIKSKFDQAVASIKGNIAVIRDSLANLIRSLH